MKHSVIKIAIFTMMSICIVISARTMAATDGGLATAVAGSTGSVNVDLTKGDLVRISNLNDLAFGNLNAVPVSVTVSDQICVYSTLGFYHLDVSSLNGLGAVTQMSDGAGNFMPYDLDIGGTPLAHLSSTALVSANTVDPTCGASTNATLNATVTNAYFAMGPAGIYTDTVTLLMTAP